MNLDKKNMSARLIEKLAKNQPGTEKTESN